MEKMLQYTYKFLAHAQTKTKLELLWHHPLDQL
jgi:hypothetical protein